MPDAIEAFFDTGHETHARFLREFGLTEADVPLVRLDKNDWAAPFSLLQAGDDVDAPPPSPAWPGVHPNLRGARRLSVAAAPPTVNGQHHAGHHPHHPPPASPTSPPPHRARGHAGDGHEGSLHREAGGLAEVDRNHDGLLSVGELTAMVRRFDKNHDGSLSVGELTEDTSDDVHASPDEDVFALAGDSDGAEEWSTQPAVDALMMGAILLLFMVAFTYFYALERDQALAGAHARVPLAPPDGK